MNTCFVRVISFIKRTNTNAKNFGEKHLFCFADYLPGVLEKFSSRARHGNTRAETNLTFWCDCRNRNIRFMRKRKNPGSVIQQ
ncbi:hypothetical protein HanIR_Chr09g0414941 [Helianthus annuus]|nr:hypothetical protein HanIR_Chr09g0414941 [Helianthus annuus]